MKKIANIIKERLSKIERDANPKIHLEGKVFTIKKEKFEDLQETASTFKHIVFVDGGNQDILTTPGFTMQKIRISKVFYESDVRKNIESIEYYILVDDEGKVVYEENNKKIEEVYEKDPISAFRKTKEFEQAKKEKDLVILDGPLNQMLLKPQIFNKTTTKKNVVGIAKTTKAQSTNKLPINYIFKTFTKNNDIKPPYIFEAFTIKNTKTFFVNMYKNRVLRIDIHHQANIHNILNSLKKHFYDASFPGYPYGLIDADDNARVTNIEISEDKLNLKTVIGNSNYTILDESFDAHDILDNMKF